MGDFFNMDEYPFLSKTICTYYPRHGMLTELFITDIGYERCEPDKVPVNSIVYPRKDYIVHYIIGGRGYLTVNEKDYMVEGNSIFYLAPNKNFNYKPDSDDPWYYLWVEYSGSAAHAVSAQCGLTVDSPVTKLKNDVIFHIFGNLLSNLIENPQYPEIFSINALTSALSEIAHQNGTDTVPEDINTDIYSSNPRLNEIVHYINHNYAQPTLSLNSLSKNFHFDPSYLSKIFHRDIGKSLSQYIMDLRLTKAFELLQTTNMMVKEVSIAVGYDDTGFFSKLFKRKFGSSPTSYFKEYIPIV